jgi:uroporphyrinogen-III decarboxylase
MAEMTPKQRLLAAIRHEEPDRVPVAPRMHMWSGEQYGSHSWLRQLKLQEEFGTDPIVEILLPQSRTWFDDHTGLARNGVEVEVRVEDRGDYSRMRRCFHTPAGDLSEVLDLPAPGDRYGANPRPVRRESLLKETADAQRIAFLFPDPQRLIREDLPLIVELIGERGLLQVGGGGAAAITRFMGMEQTMLTYYDNPEMFDRLLQVFEKHHLRVVQALLERGVPVIYNGWHDFGVSTGWSPKIYREAFKPIIQAAVDLTHRYDAVYLYFDNGAIRALLPDIAELGVDILSSLCPPPVGDVDLAEAKRSIGDRVCLHGNVDAIWVVQKGTPGQVREAVREAIRVAAAGGGFILGNSDCFFPETPRENIEAFFAAAREFGHYPVKL